MMRFEKQEYLTMELENGEEVKVKEDTKGRIHDLPEGTVFIFSGMNHDLDALVYPKGQPDTLENRLVVDAEHLKKMNQR